MKININQTIEIDPAKWAMEYGLEVTNKAVREDVQAYFNNWLQQHIEQIGMDLKAEIHGGNQ